MSQAHAKSQASEDTQNPLSELSELLNADMTAVNKQIMTHMHSSVPLIPQLAQYLIAAGGKRIRPLLTLAATSMHGGDMDRAHGLSAAVEFIHTATLLHDDVVDGSDQRRGQEAANLVFGNQASVLVGDFLFSRSFQLMVTDGSLEVLRILSNASAVIAEGEVMQLATMGDINTSMDQYIEVITSKTAALFAAACEVGPVIADAGETAAKAMHDYGLNLGIAFQIADDTLDYNADQEKLGKTIGDDFREGKITAPVLFALEGANEEESAFWKRVLSDNNQKNDDLKTAQDLFTKHKALEKSFDLANNYADQALKSLENVPQSHIRTLLESLIDYTIKRHS